MEMTDAQVVRRVLDGDTEAYAQLVSRYYDRYARYAEHMLGNRDDAQEVLQDTFVRAYRSLSRYQDRERFGAWLFRILVNRCRTAAVRRQRRERMMVVDDGAMQRASTPAAMESMGWREELERALALLPADQREAFLMKHVEDLSYEEMAVISGASVSALKMRVKRACDRMRGLLREVENVGAR